ncbi:little elongation complex subunit 1 [Dendropsophus ebraccatus]|uniref:little elongation complex subunit 1 n=1 Tax=Dendropsophus ebraccatus TaxID=150705 RepID=UPI003831914E
MMPGETHSKTAGIASEAAGSCQNCTSLQQSLNEYVAALIALKQKIIDSDQLLTEYQQKCDDLQYAERENETLRCQLEQMLQKISPQEQHQEEVKCLRAELEEKTSTLKIYQETQLEYNRIKEECEKGNIAKKKLEVKLKKMEEAAAKHDRDYKQLKSEKKVIGKELKKMQKKLDGFQSEKSKKVAIKNAQTQVAIEEPVVKLDKQKIKYLLEEIWGCIESSTENGDCKLLMLGNVGKYHLTIPEFKVRENRRQRRKTKSSLECMLSPRHSSHEVSQTCNSLPELNTVQASLHLTEPASAFFEDAAFNVLVSKDLSDCSPVNSDLENDMDEILVVQDWARPLPSLLSPIHCSPLTLKNVFGEFTDSSDNESISEMDQSNCVSQPNIQNMLENGTDENSNLTDEIEHTLIATENDSIKTTVCSNDCPDLTMGIETNIQEQTTHLLPLQESQAVTEDSIPMEHKDTLHLANSKICSEECPTDSVNGHGTKYQNPEFCESPLAEHENVVMSLDAENKIVHTTCHMDKDEMQIDNADTTSCSQSGDVTQTNKIIGKIEFDPTGGSNESLLCTIATKPGTEDPPVNNHLMPDKDKLVSIGMPCVTTQDCDQETVLHVQPENWSENDSGKQITSDDSTAHSEDANCQKPLQNSVDVDLPKCSDLNLDKTLEITSALNLTNECTKETDQPCSNSPENNHPESVLRPLEQIQQSEPLRQTPPLLSSINHLPTVSGSTANDIDCERAKENSVDDKSGALGKTQERHDESAANRTNEQNAMAITMNKLNSSTDASQCKNMDKIKYGLENLQKEILQCEPEHQNYSDLGVDKIANTSLLHREEDHQHEKSLTETGAHHSTALPVDPKAATGWQSSQVDTCNGDSAYSSNLVICDSPSSPSSTVDLNDKCMPCIDKNADTPSHDVDKPITQNLPCMLSSSPSNMAIDSEHTKVGNLNKSPCQELAQNIDFSMDLNPSISEEKNITLCPLLKADLIGVESTSSSKVLPVVPLEELQHLPVPLQLNHSSKEIEKEATDKFDISVDSSESEYEFPVRKVNFIRPALNNPVGRKDSKGDSTLFIPKKCEEKPKHIDDNDKPISTIIKPLADSNVQNDLLIEPEPSTLSTSKTLINSETNSVDCTLNEKSKDNSSLEEPVRQDDDTNHDHSSNNAEKNIKNNVQTEGQRILPGKNLIWNFTRPDDFVDPKSVCSTRKQKTDCEYMSVNLEDSASGGCVSTGKRQDNDDKLKSSSFQTIRKENPPQRVPQVGTVSLNAQVGQTILATADTSTNTGLSPEMITKVRSEMGPPLPPLLGPLLSTPPRSVRSLSPIMSSSSRSSLPSPLDELISPLPGTPFPPLMSPLCDGRKRKSPVFNTPSPAEKANRRILSSPLQFCAATPKHAVPVPGRLPLSANGSSACNVQENSVKILDTMYPELSARARTLNILKGNVHLNRGMSGDSQNVPVSQITGFKSITSTSTVFIKTGSNSKTSNKETPNTCENQLSSESCTSIKKRAIDSFQMPKSAKRLRLDSESPVAESIKDCFTTPAKKQDAQEVDESCQNFAYCEPLPDIVKGNSVDEDIITNALKKIEELCFDLLPVIRSHIHVGTIPNVPVMRNEEKEVIYDFSSSKKGLADRFLHVVLKKIKAGKRSLDSVYLQALCRVYVGLCRQLGDIERARVLCYSILKEDFPGPDKLLLFVISSWNDILSLHGVLSKAIQAVLKSLAKDEVGSCLGAYLHWEKSPPMNISVLLNSVLMAIQLYPDVKFHQSEKYGEDLTDNVWEYVFAVDLLCSHRKWTWTYDNVISKELWPMLDKWVKRKKGNLTLQFVPDMIVATVLRLVGQLCQMGLKEGFGTAVKNITSVIVTFINHANEEGVPWGVQLAAVYMLCDTAPCDPALILQTLQAWKETTKNSIPPAVINLMQEIGSLCVSNK